MFLLHLIPSPVNLRQYQILIIRLQMFPYHQHLLKDSALSLHWIWSKLVYNYKSDIVLRANTEKLQYLSLKYDKLTRENLTYSANVGAVGVYTVLIANKQYSQKFKLEIRVNKVWILYLSRRSTSWCFHDKSSDIVWTNNFLGFTINFSTKHSGNWNKKSIIQFPSCKYVFTFSLF